MARHDCSAGKISEMLQEMSTGTEATLHFAVTPMNWPDGQFRTLNNL